MRTILWHPGVGLNGAVNDSVAELRDAGVDRGDRRPRRPAAGALAGRARSQPGTVTLVPDRHGDGTNVIALPTDMPFQFAYGPGSFRRHLDAAIADGLLGRVCAATRCWRSTSTRPSDLAHPLVQEVLPAWLQTSPANQR